MELNWPPLNPVVGRMIIDFFGKLLFPRQPAWLARRQVKHLLAAISIALILGAVIMLIMFKTNAWR
jgi:hypothetical protein